MRGFRQPYRKKIPPKPKVIEVKITDDYKEIVRKSAYLGKKGYTIPKSVISKEDEENDIQRIISGTIVDSDGVPLPGASIIEVGTGKGTSSDFDGNFSFSLENEQAELEISFIGFKNQILTVTDQDNITITLLSSNSSLDEIVITGYGTSLKKELVSSTEEFSPEKRIFYKNIGTDIC